MSSIKKEYVELLNKKLIFVDKMLEMTQEVDFSGNDLEKEADKYIALYENRNTLMGHMEKLDAELSSTKYDGIKKDDSDASFVKARKQLTDKIKSSASKIIELDKKNAEISKKFTSQFKGNLKQVRDGMTVSDKYLDAYDVSGYHFDKQN